MMDETDVTKLKFENIFEYISFDNGMVLKLFPRPTLGDEPIEDVSVLVSHLGVPQRGFFNIGVDYLQEFVNKFELMNSSNDVLSLEGYDG